MIKDFYTILSHQQESDTMHRFEVELNPHCEVYKGHFPEKAIAPGVCNIEMIKECALKAMNSETNLLMGNIRTCQMIQVVDPLSTPQMLLTIEFTKKEDGKQEFVGIILHDEVPYMKMKASLINPQVK